MRIASIDFPRLDIKEHPQIILYDERGRQIDNPIADMVVLALYVKIVEDCISVIEGLCTGREFDENTFIKLLATDFHGPEENEDPEKIREAILQNLGVLPGSSGLLRFLYKGRATKS